MRWAQTGRLLIAGIAMLAGGILYLGFRTDTLEMFSWVDSLDIRWLVDGLRAALGPLSPRIPAWMVYSLPEALWLFSGILLLRTIWQNASSSAGELYVWCFFLGSLCLECSQSLGLVSGRFDPVDCICLIMAFLAAELLRQPNSDSRHEEDFR